MVSVVVWHRVTEKDDKAIKMGKILIAFFKVSFITLFQIYNLLILRWSFFFTEIDSVDSLQTSYTDTGLDLDDQETAYYKVKTKNSEATSFFSNQVRDK